MQLRLPWILSRKRLVAALAADGVLFASLYFALYELRFGVWPAFSVRIAALLVIWSLSSYVIGRYSGRANSGHDLHALNHVCRQLVATLFVLSLACNPLFLSGSSIRIQYRLHRSFLIPFWDHLPCSALLLLLLSRLFELKDLDNTVWSYVGSEEAFRSCEGCWNFFEMRVLSMLCHCILPTLSQFVVDHFYDHSSVCCQLCINFSSRCCRSKSFVLWIGPSKISWNFLLIPVGVLCKRHFAESVKRLI